MSNSTNQIFKNIFLSFMRVHVLYHAAQSPVYGMELMEELGEHGYRVGPGTIYPLLHSLEKAGCLRREEQIVEGKVRKYYYITPHGREALENIKPKIRELVNEVLV